MTTYSLVTPGAKALAVALTPDAKTLVMVDSQQVVFGAVNATHRGLISESVLPTLGLAGDNNAAISPDGQTVLTAGNGGSTVFRVAGPGNLVPGSMPQLTIPFPGIQSAS